MRSTTSSVRRIEDERRAFLLCGLAITLALVAPGVARTLAGDANARPVTLAEVRDTIDWAKAPKPEGALPGHAGLSLCSFEAPGTFADAAAFFRKSLPALGWREDTGLASGGDQMAYLNLSFEKKGVCLSVSGYRADPKKPMTITIMNCGNVDLRQLPKPADARFRANGRLAAFYTTGATPGDAADSWRKALAERGWQEVPADSAKFFAKEGRTVLRFLQNAMEVGVITSKNAGGETEVTVTAGVRQKFDADEVRRVLTAKATPTPPNISDYVSVIDLRSFPLMKDAGKRERQTEPIARSNAIICQAPGTQQEAIDHHRKHLLERGWKETSAGTSVGDRSSLHYEKQGYLLTVDAGQRGGEPVQISVVNHGNVDLRQLPYPPGTEIAPERGEFLNCTTPVPPGDAVEFYRRELNRLGWREVKVLGRGSYEFFQNATILRLEIGRDTEGRTALSVRSGLISAD